MTRISLFFAALFALASWLAPNHELPWLSFHAEFMMALALLIAVGGECLSPRVAGCGGHWTPLMRVTLVLATIPLLQALTGLIRFAGEAWMAGLYLVGFAIAQWLGQRLAARLGLARFAEGLALLFVTVSVLAVGLQLYQWLRLEGLGLLAAPMRPGGTPFANFAQPNHLATLLFMGLTGVLLLYERQRIGGLGTALAATLLEFGMVMTGSRTAWLALALLAAALLLARRRLALRLTLPAVAVLGMGFVLLVLVWAPLNDALLLSVGRTLSNQADVGPRPLFYATMLDAIARAPWFGYGWNQGLVAQMHVLDEHPAGGRLMGNSHNLVLDLMVWNGVPLGLAISAFLAWWLWRKARQANDAVQGFALLAVAGVGVHAMLEFPLSYAYFLLPTGVLMGLLDAAAPAGRRFMPPRFVFGSVAAAAAALLVWVTIEYVEVEANTRVLAWEVARIGTDRIESQAPDLVLLTQWREYLRFARIEPQPGMKAEQLAWMAQVAERYPYSPSLLRLAQAQALNGQAPDAQRTLARLCALHTAARCRAALREWREQVRTAHPQLATVPLPAQP